jgi:hypothetical protein
MVDIPKQVKQRMIGDGLRAHFEATLQQRVERHIEVTHQPITPNPHFAAASAECISLYTDGYFISTVMVTQAVAEGIRKFLVERNEIKLEEKMDGPQAVSLLLNQGIVSNKCADAFNRIYKGFRNDVHHMNPKVAQIDFPKLSKSNIQDLATIEREVFAFKWGNNGGLIPANPKYWDTRADGKIGAFLRLEP